MQYRFTTPLGLTFAILTLACQGHATVSFLGFDDDVTDARGEAAVPGQQCLDATPPFGPNALSVGDSRTCSAGSDPVTASGTGSISGEFNGTVDDVDSITISATGEAEGSAPGLSSRSGIGAGGVKVTFNVNFAVRYNLSLNAAASDSAFGAFGQSGTSAFASGPLDNLEVDQTGFGSQTRDSSGILNPGTHSLLVSVSATANASFVQDIATASASATITFTPITGGCCIGGNCIVSTAQSCGEEGGTFLGPDEPCIDCPEPPTQCNIGWADPTGGTFGNTSNWSPNEVPTDDNEGCNNIFMDLPGLYTVELGADRRGNSLFVSNGGVTLEAGKLTLSGRTSPANKQAGPQPAIGVGQEGILKIGTDATIDATRATVGDSGAAGDTGTLSIQQGGTVNLSGELSIGKAVSGTLDMPGGQLTTASALIGDGSSGLSTANVRGDAQWTTGALTIADDSDGRLDIDAGGLVTSTEAKAGDFPGFDAEANIVGENARWVINGPFTIGTLGVANINVRDGGSITAGPTIIDDIAGEGGALRITGQAGAPARVTVNGNLRAGLGAEGSPVIEVKQGANLKVTGDAIIGESDEVVLTIADAGAAGLQSLMEVTGALTLGAEGSATAKINSGGKITAAELIIGETSGTASLSMIVEDGAAGTPLPALEIEGDATIGARAEGFFDLFDGSEATVGNLIIGSAATGAGVVSVFGTSEDDDASTLDSLGAITVGFSGTGKLNVQRGGLVTSGDRIDIGTFTSGGTSQGLLVMQGRPEDLNTRVRADGEIRVGGDSGVVRMVGRTEIDTQQALRITANGSVSMTRNARIVAAQGVTNNGIMQLVPGDGSKQTSQPATVEGDFTNEAGGRLIIEVQDGDTALLITGNAALGGTLEVRFADNVALSPNAQFNLLDIQGSASGGFAQTLFPTRDAEFQGTVQVNGGTLTLTIVNPGGPAGGEGEEEGDGEGEAPVAPAGCNCNGDKATMEHTLGNLLMMLLGLAVLLAAAMHRTRTETGITT